MVEHVKRLKRELVYKGAILDIYKDTMELPDGNKAEWDFVSHRMGAAAILPVMKDGRIVMVRQYRNALERETLEIPAGCRDSKMEDTAYCAAREMEEETGYRSTNVKHLLSLRTTVAFCDEAVDIFVATDLEVGTRHLDEAESIDGKFRMEKPLLQLWHMRQQKKAEWENIWIYKNGIKKTDRA